MLVLLCALAFSGAAFAQRNPNPCLLATGTTSFVRDWAHCGSYFWCNATQALPTGPCPDTFFFDEPNQSCDSGFVCDPLECPVDITIAVAVADDATCTQYLFCLAGVRDVATVLTCPTGTMFNRVTGICDLPANVICPGGGGSVAPPGQICQDALEDPWTGDVNSDTACDAFQFCNEGVLEDEIFSCGVLHFNPAIGGCDLPAALDPPCTPTVGSFHQKLERFPKVKNVNSAISFRKRLLAQFHARQ